MLRFYEVKEECLHCKTTIRSVKNCYVDPRGSYIVRPQVSLFRGIFQVPCWCKNCNDFQTAYNPIAIEAVHEKIRHYQGELRKLASGIFYFSIFRYFSERRREYDWRVAQMQKYRNILEFADKRDSYSLPSCMFCGSSEIDVRWSDRHNNLVSADKPSGVVHSCGVETRYVIEEGHYSTRSSKKADWTKYDCNDQIISRE